MRKPARIISAFLAGAILAGGGCLAGYEIGHAQYADAQTLHDAKCSAVEGLSLTPSVPLARVTPECVWRSQVSAREWLDRALTKQCLCS